MAYNSAGTDAPAYGRRTRKEKIEMREFARKIGAAAVLLCALHGAKLGAQTKTAPSAIPLVFKFVWKEEFTDRPRRIAVGDVTGDGATRLVTLNEKPDDKNASVLMVRKWDGKTFVKEFEAQTQSPPDKLQVGKFAGATKPAVILTADALWTWNGKTFARKLAAKPINLFGATRLRTGEERVLIAASPKNIKAYRVSPDGAGDFLTDPIESPNSKAVTWGDMHAATAFLNEMDFPDTLSGGGLVGLWDARRNGKLLMYYAKVDRDIDVKSGGTKPEFVVKKQTYFLAASDTDTGHPSDLWISPALPAPLLDAQVSDAKPGNAAGFLLLLGEPGQDKHRLIAFVALEE